jgi:ribose 5-phosphate isomerase B
MGGRVIGEALAEEIVHAWLETPFEGGRHQERIDNFENFERIEQRLGEKI